MKTAPITLLIATIAGALAVLLGAFGAHALRDVLGAQQLEIWHTAVQYQFWHALALFGCSVLMARHATRATRIAAIAFTCGLILFCASLYALALGAPRQIGIITPFGGLAFIIGWLSLAWHAWQMQGELL